MFSTFILGAEGKTRQYFIFPPSSLRPDRQSYRSDSGLKVDDGRRSLWADGRSPREASVLSPEDGPGSGVLVAFSSSFGGWI